MAKLPAQADVVIIGSGMSGASTAYYLAKRRPELSICILDARDISGGATGRNGGLVHPASLWEIPVLAQEFGLKYALQYYSLEHATRKAMRALDATLPGNRTLDLDVDKVMLFNDDDAMAKKLGLGWAPLGRVVYSIRSLLWPFGLQVWDKSHCNEQLRLREGHGVVGGVCIPQSTDTVNASEITDRIVQQAIQQGVQMHSYTRVEGVHRDEEAQLRVRTSRGDVQAGHVVYATNAWTPRVLPEMEGRIVPARNHVVCIAPMESLCRDGRRAGFGGLGNNYWVQRPDGRVICGGFRHLAEGGEVGIDDDASLSKEIMEDPEGPRVFLRKSFEMEEMEIEEEWSGIIANSCDGVPWCGPLSPARANEYLCAGFSGHGMTTALLCGQSIAGMICGDPAPSVMSPLSICYGAFSPQRRDVAF